MLLEGYWGVVGRLFGCDVEVCCVVKSGCVVKTGCWDFVLYL